MKYRIAFSVTCGILCLLLIVLWVQSYWWADNVIGPSHRFAMTSGNGWLTVWIEDWGFQFPYWMPTVVVGILAVVTSWRHPWRFSLRTLLIVMTHVAAGLGAIAWALRSN
jgi:hypothetical protein